MASNIMTHEPVVAPPTDATRLALDRTRLAFERTTMAWVRTATSLITFGFSVYKFFDLQQHRQDTPGRLIGSREFALAMISIGIISLVLASLQNWQSMRTLREHYRDIPVPRSLAVVLGMLLSVLGLLALGTVILRR